MSRRRNPDFPDFLPEDIPEPEEPEPRPGGLQNWPPERGPIRRRGAGSGRRVGRAVVRPKVAC